MVTSEQFLQQLRSALNHLYDPYFLQKSPMVRWFRLGDQPDAPSALQSILTEAIEALEPKKDSHSANQKRRMYDLMMYRYVQQFSQEEVARQFGLSVRHFRREQNAAIFKLAAMLWEQFELSAKPFESQATEDEEESVAASPTEEFDWLRDTSLEEPTNLSECLGGVLDLHAPIIQQYQVRIKTNLPSTLPQVLGQPVALRQILINLIDVMLHQAPGRELNITALRQDQWVVVTFSVPGLPANPSNLSENDLISLSLIDQLIEISHGRFERPTTGPKFEASLLLPALEEIQVLVVDDNADIVQMIERFIANTCYHVTALRDPALVVDHAEKTQPDLILLDVMMPRIDGWEVLGRLRQHPRTAHIPVIVCTILPQEELARSLGAAGFLRKPVTRERLLAALDLASDAP